jgi:signal transduction histidine kinase
MRTLALVTDRLSARAPLPNRGIVNARHRSAYQAWLVGEVLLFGLLSAGLALFVAYPDLLEPRPLPAARLVLDTTVLIAGILVAILAAARYAVERRRLELLLSAGFVTVSSSILFFAVVPAVSGSVPSRAVAWANVAGRTLGWALIAAAPAVRGRVKTRGAALAIGITLPALGALWLVAQSVGPALPDISGRLSVARPPLLTTAFGVQAVLLLGALVGFGLRYRNRGEDLDRWLALGSTLMLFVSLTLIFTPLLGPDYVSQADFLGVLAYAVLIMGVSRAILSSEFGHAVAEERARVAREIHDGLAQYLFAVSTHAAMLEAGADPAQTLPQLREAAAAAQQEAKFAVLALSSASGNAPFDAALRRYVEFLVADGALAVDLEIDKEIRLGPDEQIEVFRIVQEGLANVRRHAGATHAEVVIGRRHDGERVVVVRDDGDGFAGEPAGAGQGLPNMKTRAAAIGGSFRLSSTPGGGTAVEVVLRA